MKRWYQVLVVLVLIAVCWLVVPPEVSTESRSSVQAAGSGAAIRAEAWRESVLAGRARNRLGSHRIAFPFIGVYEVDSAGSTLLICGPATIAEKSGWRR